jgi:hypothetical protein
MLNGVGSYRLLFTIGLLLCTGLIGCTEELEPRDPYQTPFSLYGVLSPAFARQSI